MSYAQLKQAVDEQARRFESLGLQAGDAVVLALENSAWLVATILGIMRCGAVAIPINPTASLEEASFSMEDSEARFFVMPPGSAEHFSALSHPKMLLNANGHLDAQPSADRKRREQFAQDTCLMIYTSGTTSRPKGVPLTRDNLLASVRAFAGTFQLSDQDATLVPMPFFHVHGLIGATLSTLFTGGKAVVQPRFSASRFWNQVKEQQVSWYTASPTIHRILLARVGEDDIPRGQLRFIRSSSASLGTDTLENMEKHFGSVVLEAYGMTEAANQISCNPLPPGVRKATSVGTSAGIEIAVLDDKGKSIAPGSRGQVAIRGAAVMSGYYRRAEINAASFLDGWFLTGDEGYFDQDGYLYIVGRIKELINRGGEKISPFEVEEVLLRHPLVQEAACFGVPDTKYGEQVHAVVVFRGTCSADEVLAFCTEHMSAIKVPEKIHVADNIPRTPTNKVRRQELAARFTNS